MIGLILELVNLVVTIGGVFLIILWFGLQEIHYIITMGAVGFLLGKAYPIVEGIYPAIAERKWIFWVVVAFASFIITCYLRSKDYIVKPIGAMNGVAITALVYFIVSMTPLKLYSDYSRYAVIPIMVWSGIYTSNKVLYEKRSEETYGDAEDFGGYEEARKSYEKGHTGGLISALIGSFIYTAIVYFVCVYAANILDFEIFNNATLTYIACAVAFAFSFFCQYMVERKYDEEARNVDTEAPEWNNRDPRNFRFQ